MNLLSKVRSIPTHAWTAAAIVTAVVAIPASLLAWGPDRPTYTMAHPADHVTFNSITDNPAHGDERNFVQIRNLTDNGTFGENVDLVAGKEYQVYVFYHNNAASNLNDAAHNYVGVAKGAYMRAELPASVAAGANGRVNGYVGANNATPKEVWDEAYMKNPTASPMSIYIEPGSAKITNNGATNGKTLPDALFSTGTPLGYDQFDGVLPGCTQYSGYVMYKFKAEQPNFTVEKTVSKHDATQYGENVTVNAGDLVDFKIKYQNTGTISQSNVKISDHLPAHMSYVAGSTYLSNSSTGNQWQHVSADTVTTSGLNIGTYAPGGAGFVRFTAKVGAASELACGMNTLTNTATATTDSGSKSDTASVGVNKVCQPNQVEACNLSTFKVETVDKSKIDNVHYTTDLSKCQEQVCRISDKTIITINKSEYDTNVYTTDLSMCTPTTPPVTELPHTGIADSILSVLGLGSLVGVGSAYWTSRKQS